MRFCAHLLALQSLEARGILFIKPGTRFLKRIKFVLTCVVHTGTEVYTGMIIGEHSRDNDLDVNPVRAKKLTNVRAAGTVV